MDRLTTKTVRNLALGAACALVLAGCFSIDKQGTSDTAVNGPVNPTAIGGVASTNGIIALAGTSSAGAAEVETSTDGVSWSPGTWTDPNASATVVGLWASTSAFLMEDSAAQLFVSSDGVNWSLVVLSGFSTSDHVSFDSTEFVIVHGATILTSPDGKTWTTAIVAATGGPVSNVEKVGGIWQALSAAGVLLASPDLAVWTPVSNTPLGAVFTSINATTISGKPALVAVGSVPGGTGSGGTGTSATGVVAQTFDGSTETYQTLGFLTNPNLQWAEVNPAAYVLVGQGGVIEQSSDNVHWSAATAAPAGSTNAAAAAAAVSYTGLTVAGNNFVLAGNWSGATSANAPPGVEFVSADGLTWTQGAP